jgi:RNA recognition motif-containing protein
MSTKLYVGNLSQRVEEGDLRSNFSEVGKVLSVHIIKDRYTGLSKGFGFVEMETAEGAQEAINRFHGGQLDGNTIVVDMAKPKKDRGSSRPTHTHSGGIRGFGGDRSGGYRR